MHDCKAKKSDRKGSSQPAARRQVTTETGSLRKSRIILELLYSSDSEDGYHVNQTSVTDGGSKSQLAHMDIQGVPTDGVVEKEADIAIMGESCLPEWHLWHVFAGKTFVKATKFRGSTMERPSTWMAVWIRMYSLAAKPLGQLSTSNLLSEGVCRLLGIVMYHPSVQSAPENRRLSERLTNGAHHQSSAGEDAAFAY